MQLGECAVSLKRVFAFFPNCGAEDRKSYILALHEQFGWLAPSRFDAVCVRIVKKMEEFKPPAVHQYKEVYDALCRDNKWVPVPSVLSEDLELYKVRLYTPGYAKSVLALIRDGTKPAYPDSVMDVLRARASLPE